MKIQNIRRIKGNNGKLIYYLIIYIIITIKDIEKKLKGLTSAFYRGQSLFTN